MLLEALNIYKTFDDTVVLNDVSLNINKGEIVSLVGKSGSGKTTFLRCIMGLEKCDKGTISINGKYICKTEDGIVKRATKKELFEIRKELGMVFQNYHLFPHMTVMENVTLALVNAYKIPKPTASDIAIKMLERLEMGDKLNSKPSQLSGGQKQRAAIARSIVQNPKLLCFDEPTAALDSALVSGVIKIIKNLAADGMGILVVSHDENFVRNVSDRVLVMGNGKILKRMNAEEYKNVIVSS
ncbi:MAG: amino acid ABC transporter ATP-binding protein [Lachnospiraceae bacterium]|nr:amino acid ABC transporter ATP-binding protein [Lachnospiraceae bacterium]